MEIYLDIALIITSIALIASVILQSKGAGLGGLTGADTGGIFTARRGIEKTLFPGDDCAKRTILCSGYSQCPVLRVNCNRSRKKGSLHRPFELIKLAILKA